MHLCVKLQYFKNYCGDLSDHRRPCYLLLSKFLLGLLAHCKQYKGDLQVSCLQAILETPAELVQPLIPQAISAFQVMFRLGHSMLSLAQQALTTLEQWCQLLPAEDMKPLLTAVLPELDPYLQSSGFEGDIEEAIDWELIKPSKNLSKNRTTKLIRKTLIERPETELSKLQRRIVIFLGCLETNTCLSLIEGGKKVQCDVWDSSQHLAYAIPFIDMKPSINIDNILPRVIELCLGCSDRQTRIVACEFLHAVIMYMLGTNLKMEVSKPGYLSKMFSHMVMPLLQLGCDSDQIVHQLYHPLMLQLAHWYSSAVQLGSVHTQILIETLMDGITHPTDTALRDYSAKCLREFVIWSIKQSRAKDLEKSQTNIKAVLKKMFSLCVHPSPTKRLGGALVFNSIYSVLREEKSILEIFWLEILYYLVSNLAMTDGPDSNSVNVNSQVVLALDHVERVFLEKSALFTQVNSKRRTPPGFLGSCLVDVVMWLLHQCSSSAPDCRHKCMHMVCRICLKLPGISSVAAYMNMYNQLQLLDICEKKTMVSTSPSSDAAGGSLCDQIVHWLNRLLTSLDCYVWLLGEDFVPLHKLFQVPENAQPTIKIFQALAHFIEHICSVPLSELLGWDSIYLLPRDEERYNRIKCFVTVRLCDFTRAILQHPDGSIYIPSTFPITKLWSLVATCIFHPSKVGFDMRSIEVLEKLPGNLQDLLQVIKNTDCLEELVKIIDEIMGDGYEQLLNELQYNLKNDLIPEWQTLYIQGMCTVQISGLIEYLKIDISAEKVVTTIFSALVETDGSSKMLIPLQPTAQAYAESLLKFAFLLHNQVDILVELVMNDSKLLIHHSQTSLSHGEHFLLTFKTTILSHWLMYPDHCIGLLLDRVDSQCGRMVLGVLTEFLQFAAHNKRHKHRVSMAAEKVVTNRWDTLQEWGNANPDNAYRLLGVLCDMAATQQNAIGCLMKHKSVCDWVMIQISSQNLTMNHKNHALDLLPCLTSPVEDINHELTTSLKALKHQHFPHRSSELVKDSLEYIGFMLAFHKLLTGLEVTGSRVLLHAVVASSASDPHHICEDSIQRTLKSFICRLQKEDQLKAVEVPYQVFLSTDYDPVIRLGAVERFCRSMLLCCSEPVVRQFLCSHVQALRELLDEKLSGASGVKNEHQLVGKIGAWMLMGVMFSQLDPQELESVDCPITRAAMTGPVITGKELIVHLTKGAFNARCENTPPAPSIDSRVPDLFRQYQCTAYNTLVTIVSNTKRSAAELKFYQGFLFTENRDKNQLLWEKLVDCSRTYTFPMDWEEIPKRRKKMVGIRRMACQSGSTEVNYLPTHSQYLFDSTLREDVTQFDFTTSLVLSDSVTLPHSDVPDSLEVTLESDSLNEHECMSTLCGLIQHMVQCGISPLPQALLDRCAGTDMNYFLIDIIAMLLSWYDVAIPQSSDVFASEILHFLIANIHHNRRDIFKHNLEVIKTLVEVWKPCLSIPKQQLLDGIVPKGGPDSRDTEAGIQLVGVMLANDIHPWSETGKKLFLDKLLSNMDSNQREKLAGMFRVLCLEMIHSRLVTIQQSLYLTLVDVGLMEYLRNRESDVQELALKIVYQAAPRIEPTQLALIFPEVCRFGSHGVLACRRVMYEIAMWVYTKFRQRIDESDVEMSLFEESKVILLRGLVDSDSALQETVFKFWNTDAHFPAGTAHRLITLLTELYSPRTEPNFLAYSTQLLLEATALGPDFNRKIFDHPLSACKFEDLKVLVSWRAQHTSIAPMFAETFVSQPNTQAPGSLDMVVRATQTSLEFQPTLDQGEDVVDASNTSFSSFANSSLLFSVGSLGDKSRRARARRGDQQLDNSAEVVNSNPSSSYLRRRFLKDKEKIRIGFASREVLRKHRREEHLKERVKKREATVNMYRSYRIGDLPDIEILHSALIQPLRVLAKRDSSIGRQLLVSLFSGILVEMGDGADWFTARSAEALGDILSSSTLSCPPVIGTVLEIALANSQHINLDIESITTASQSSGLLALGSLLLEQMLMKGADEGQRPPKRARVRTDTGQQLWLKLAEYLPPVWPSGQRSCVRSSVLPKYILEAVGLEQSQTRYHEDK
uniref:DNA-dependent protein kinase catalytic subunit CC3 domain-containing protein n=1 Tax=Timema monikensis TaxID=170555 RepID=A0A7R9EEF5_9NEOP|nr:unnamed protein product [Timema monikensis]